MAILELNTVSKRFGGLSAVKDLNIDIKEHSITALIGPNGAGKTTVFNMITGANSLSAGNIFFDGKKINGLPPYKITKLGITRTYQNIRLFKKMTALENVMTGFHSCTKSGMINIVFKRNEMKKEEKMVREKSLELLEYLNLRHFENVEAQNLPYGHQRLLEIARALALGPKLLLLDEPAAGMNSDEKKELIKTINNIKEDFNVAVFLVEHDMELVMNISDVISVLNYGELIASGTPEEVQKNEQVIEAYLGRKDEGCERTS